MNVFNWEKIRPKLHEKNLTRNAVIKAAFQQWIDGHSDYDDISSAELEGLFGVFEASWIICEDTIKRSI